MICDICGNYIEDHRNKRQYLQIVRFVENHPLSLDYHTKCFRNVAGDDYIPSKSHHAGDHTFEDYAETRSVVDIPVQIQHIPVPKYQPLRATPEKTNRNQNYLQGYLEELRKLEEEAREKARIERMKKAYKALRAKIDNTLVEVPQPTAKDANK